MEIDLDSCIEGFNVFSQNIQRQMDDVAGGHTRSARDGIDLKAEIAKCQKVMAGVLVDSGALQQTLQQLTSENASMRETIDTLARNSETSQDIIADTEAQVHAATLAINEQAERHRKQESTFQDYDDKFEALEKELSTSLDSFHKNLTTLGESVVRIENEGGSLQESIHRMVAENSEQQQRQQSEDFAGLRQSISQELVSLNTHAEAHSDAAAQNVLNSMHDEVTNVQENVQRSIATLEESSGYALRMIQELEDTIAEEGSKAVKVKSLDEFKMSAANRPLQSTRQSTSTHKAAAVESYDPSIAREVRTTSRTVDRSSSFVERSRDLAARGSVRDGAGAGSRGSVRDGRSSPSRFSERNASPSRTREASPGRSHGAHAASPGNTARRDREAARERLGSPSRSSRPALAARPRSESGRTSPGRSFSRTPRSSSRSRARVNDWS